MYVVPAPGADRRFLGGSAHARNARVAARAGAALRTPDTIAPGDTTSSVLVPPETALMLPLFADPVFLDAAVSATPLWLRGPDGAAVLVGPAHLVAAMPPLAPKPGADGRPVGPGALLNIATAMDRWRSMRAALRATQKATDGWVSRTCNRPISRACSALALTLGMSATTASLITLAFGLLTAWTAAQPGYWPLVLTGVLFHLASVLDGVDGEIARATLTESERGARVDTLVDQATYLACFAGMTIGWVREGSGQVVFAAIVVTALALVATLLRAGRFVARHANDASFVFVDRSVRRAARDTGRLPLRLAAGLFTLLRRDVFAVIFLAAALTGERAAIPALVLAGVAIANLTFTLYGRELEAAAVAERLGATRRTVTA